MTRDEWIRDFAERLGVERPSLEEIRALLDIAGKAAHASERTAAPLACWLVGRSGMPADQALAVATELAGGQAPQA